MIRRDKALFILLDDFCGIALRKLIHQLAARLKVVSQASLHQLGFQLCSVDRLGVEVECEMWRLTWREPVEVVFDVGANVGQTAQRFVRAFPQADVFSFEPVPEAYLELQRNTLTMPRLKTFNLAMGQAPGRAVMQVGARSTTTSFIHSGAATGVVVEVDVVTIDQFCLDHNVRQVDLLKIDVEGFELQVLRGGKKMIEDGLVRYVYAECDFAADEDNAHTDFFRLTEYMSGLGFCIVAVYSQSFSLRYGSSLVNVLYALKSRLPVTAAGRTKNIV